MAFESVLSLDYEVGTKTANKRKATRWHPDNYIVAEGYKYGDGEVAGVYHDERGELKLPDLTGVKLLVGFNIKFDLLWIWDSPELQEFFKRGGRVWDGQYVEYLLQGMLPAYHMTSMNETVLRYGGTLKMDVVKEMWESGIDTPDIPKDILMKYLVGDADEELAGDVNNTWLIFIGQMKRIKKDFPPETLRMIENRMDGLLATTEMEFNGLKLDAELGNELQAKQKKVLIQYDRDLEGFIPELPEGLIFNWNSIYHKSYLIYGGSAKYLKWVQHIDEHGNGLYSKKTVKAPLINGEPYDPTADELTEEQVEAAADRYIGGKRVGQIKYKNIQVPDYTKPKGCKQEFSFTFPGFAKPKDEWKSTLTDAKDKHIYSTGADIIEELAATQDVPFLKLLQKRQKLKKDLGTYYWDEDDKGNRKGMLTLINNEDGLIHHKLNHTSTVTSRLSSSDPNMQNIPKKDKSDVKQLFISRFKDGRMAEIDYSQLEVVVQGILSRDKQLCTDLRNRVDFHCKRLSIKLGEDYVSVVEKVGREEIHSSGRTYNELRGDIKSFTFERAYGAGATSIAVNNNIPLDEVKELIEIEETMYPGVVAFDKTVEASINATRKLTNIEVYVAGHKYRLGRGHWFAPTGTKYVWTEGEAPKFLHKHGKFTGFKPTERKNYPIQGTGGEIVQTMVGILWRWLISQDRFDGKALLVNTVHDCVWLDLADTDTVDRVVPMTCKILESVPAKFNKDFNMQIDVPFPVEAEVGTNMYNLKHYNWN